MKRSAGGVRPTSVSAGGFGSLFFIGVKVTPFTKEREVKTHTRYATITETMTYRIAFEAPEDADADTLDELARDEWELNPGRKPVDYTAECEVDDIVSDESRSYGPRK